MLCVEKSVVKLHSFDAANLWHFLPFPTLLAKDLNNDVWPNLFCYANLAAAKN